MNNFLNINSSSGMEYKKHYTDMISSLQSYGKKT